MKFSFIAYGLPKPAGSKRAFARLGKDGRPFATVVDACAKTKSWQGIVAAAAGEAMQGQVLSGAVQVNATFYFPRPKSHYGTGKNARVLKASAPAFHLQKPDASKCFRAAEDSMSRVVYLDDVQVVRQFVQKAWGEPARVEIEISTLE